MSPYRPIIRDDESLVWYKRRMTRVCVIDLKPSAKEVVASYEYWQAGCNYHGLSDDYHQTNEHLATFGGIQVEIFRPARGAFMQDVLKNISRMKRRGRRGINPIELLLLRSCKEQIGRRVVIASARMFYNKEVEAGTGVRELPACLDFRSPGDPIITEAQVDVVRRTTESPKRAVYCYATTER